MYFITLKTYFKMYLLIYLYYIFTLVILLYLLHICVLLLFILWRLNKIQSINQSIFDVLKSTHNVITDITTKQPQRPPPWITRQQSQFKHKLFLYNMPYFSSHSSQVSLDTGGIALIWQQSLTIVYVELLATWTAEVVQHSTGLPWHLLDVPLSILHVQDGVEVHGHGPMCHDDALGLVVNGSRTHRILLHVQVIRYTGILDGTVLLEVPGGEE